MRCVLQPCQLRLGVPAAPLDDGRLVQLARVAICAPVSPSAASTTIRARSTMRAGAPFVRARLSSSARSESSTIKHAYNSVYQRRAAALAVGDPAGLRPRFAENSSSTPVRRRPGRSPARPCLDAAPGQQRVRRCILLSNPFRPSCGFRFSPSSLHIVCTRPPSTVVYRPVVRAGCDVRFRARVS
jgi:hypothetical protein